MKKFFVPGALILCIAVSVVMWILKPIPHGHRYDLAFQLSLVLALVWLLCKVPLEWISKRGLLLAVLVVGLGWGAFNIIGIDPQSEIVGAYRSVFEAVDSGKNPYTCGTIFHRGEDGNPVYGNFNYPPAEIYPYYLAYKIFGRWDSAVLTGVMLFLNGLCCLILLMMFKTVRAGCLAAFFPLFLAGEIKTNPSLTFLITALLLWLMVKDWRKPAGGRFFLIAVLFGVGLMTKFLIMPLMAAYYWHAFNPWKPRSLVRIAGGGAIALGTAALIMAPFGVGAVLKNTILFNLVLKDRAVLTTFYPNVLSGPLNWAGLGAIYPLAALAVVGLAVLAAPRLSLFPAMLTASFAFLLAAPTPEPQYLPIVLFMALASRCLEMEERGPCLLRLRKPVRPTG